MMLSKPSNRNLLVLWVCRRGMAARSMLGNLRITLNKRLATAAAAMVQRMISLSKLLVLRPESPFRKGVKGLDDMLSVCPQSFHCNTS